MVGISKTLGKRIRYLRKLAGLSQEQLALKARMAPSFLGEIERCDKNPSIESVEKIAIALDISMAELFNYDTETLQNSDDFLYREIAHVLTNMNPREKEVIYEIVRQVKSISDDHK